MKAKFNPLLTHGWIQNSRLMGKSRRTALNSVTPSSYKFTQLDCDQTQSKTKIYHHKNKHIFEVYTQKCAIVCTVVFLVQVTFGQYLLDCINSCTMYL